jgi:hypothetical protein
LAAAPPPPPPPPPDDSLDATLFAPTDAAFTKLLQQLNLTAGALLNDTSLVSTVLSYHLVPGDALYADDLKNGKSYETALEDKKIKVGGWVGGWMDGARRSRRPAAGDPVCTPSPFSPTASYLAHPPALLRPRPCCVSGPLSRCREPPPRPAAVHRSRRTRRACSF